MRVHRVRVAGEIHIDPILDRADLRRLGRRAIFEMHAVEVEEPGDLSRIDLVERDVARAHGVVQDRRAAARQARRNRTGPACVTVVPTRICITCSSEGAGVATGFAGLWVLTRSVSPARRATST